MVKSMVTAMPRPEVKAPTAHPPTAAPAIAEGDAVLSDGTTVHLRSLAPDDRDRLVAFFDALSKETRRRRFFNVLSHLEGPLLDHLMEVDQDNSIVIVAERNGAIVGVGRSNRTMQAGAPADEGESTAEVAFTVGDEWQGLGVGTLLLEALASRARLVGITRFVALTQADNGAMLRVFRTAGYEASLHRDPEDPAIISISFPIAADDTSRAAQRARERLAAAASLHPLLRPRSIAVVGASGSQPSPGRRVVQELLANDFTGAIFPVNPHADAIESLRAFRSIADIGAAIDLAVIAVPAESVIEVARQCASAGVRAIVVISAGFAEVGETGRARQAELVDVVRASGMRLVGPNCLGIITTDDSVRMHAMFTTLEPDPGGVAVMSQSGAVAIAIATTAKELGVGLSSLVSVGNKADVSGNDLLEYWDQDATTRVIGLYLESFGNPRKFARIAREVSLQKPIVAIKAARSAAGLRAAASHTGALTALDATVDALFEQAGVLRVGEPRELLELAFALDHLPLPRGRRVAIVGNAGGLAILTADALAGEGLALADLGPATINALRDVAPAHAAVANPVDLTANVAPELLETALRLVLDDPGVDGVVVAHISVIADDQRDAVRMVARVGHDATKPIVMVFGSPPERNSVGAAERASVAGMATPREAAMVMSRMVQRYEWLTRQEDIVRPIDPTALERIHAIVAEAMMESTSGGWLPAVAAFEVIRLAGIAVAGPLLAADADEAAAIANAIGYPVCLKAASPALVHRSDVGAIRIGLRDEYNVVCAFQAIEHSLGVEMGGALVQPMAASGVEMIVGLTNDPQFGPLVVVGAGGRNAEIWRDTAVHLAPIGVEAANAMVRSLRSHRLLTGFRGAAAADERAIIDAVLRVAQLGAEVPEIAELDINPVIVHAKGATAVDVKMRLASNDNPLHDELRMLR